MQLQMFWIRGYKMASNCECCNRIISNNDFPYCSDCRYDDNVKLRELHKQLGSWYKAEARLKELIK